MRTLATVLLLVSASATIAAAQTDSTAAQIQQAPRLLNVSEISVELTLRYPRELRQLGVTGTVYLRMFVDTALKADSTYVYISSGVPAFDRIARSVASKMKFAPAQPRGGGRWVELPVTFGDAASQRVLAQLPRLTNREAVSQVAQTFMLPKVNDVRIGADIGVALEVDSSGQVQKIGVYETSCSRKMDDAAHKLAQLMKFQPAAVAGPRRTYAIVRFGNDSVDVRLAGDTIHPDTARQRTNSAIDTTAGTTRKPELTNRDMVARELVRAYPPALRDQRVGATVILWALIDENGRPAFLKVNEGSEHCEFNLAALVVGRSMRFKPALNKGKPVSVFVQLPIIWKTQ